MAKVNKPAGETGKTQSILGNTFTVRIQNTGTTTPEIVTKELENVVINKDTTINFYLTYIPVATVDLDSLHQVIRGFGAANVILWRPDMTDSEIQTAFGTGPGQLGFSILRIMLEPDSTRWSLYVPTAKKAHDMGAIVIASPWFAPSDMSETVGSISRVRHDMYAQYAAHLNAFNVYMKNHGVPIYGISIQNEPDITENWTSWTSDEMFTFMKDYADLIKGTKVMAPESFHFDRTYSDPILNDSAACANTDIVDGHIYGSGLSKYPLAEEKGKEVWMTEHYTESAHSGNDWPLALDVAKEMQSVMKADMSAYVWWYIVRYYGPIAEGEMGTRKGEVTKRGYIMSQFSKFIRPGYHRVEGGVYPSLSNVTVTAYKDSSSSKIIIVAVNPGTTQTLCGFRIPNLTSGTSFTTYTTSATQNVEQGNNVTATDGSFNFNLEPSSITTFVSQ